MARTKEDKHLTIDALMEIQFNLYPNVWFTPATMALTIQEEHNTVRRVMQELLERKKIEKWGRGFYRKRSKST